MPTNLALIETDHGPELARQVARELVVYHRRAGSQSQLAPISQMESDRIRIALSFPRDHLHEALPSERLAEAARPAGPRRADFAEPHAGASNDSWLASHRVAGPRAPPAFQTRS